MWPLGETIRASRRAFGAAALTLLPGCISTTRLDAVPRGRFHQARVLGLPNERFYYSLNAAPLAAEFLSALERWDRTTGLAPNADSTPLNMLSVSGGGEDGAFGAGLLCGMTAAGTRPVYNLVTGVSTGALTAPFAFLGPAYDAALRDVYTNLTIADIADTRNYLAAVFADALTDTTPLFRTISRHLNDAMLADIAKAYTAGRILLIGTTDLDAQVPVVWNIGAIAASGDPRAAHLIRRILLASAAIPGAFPAVMFDVTLDGLEYQEMHVDGGAFAQAFLYPRGVGEMRADRRRTGKQVRSGQVSVIRNGRLDPGWASVRRRVFGITGRAISTMIYSSGYGDVVRMWTAAQQDGFDYNLAFIGSEFSRELATPFEQAYMRELFDYGYQRALDGKAWVKRPPIGKDLAMAPPAVPEAARGTP